VSGGRGRVVQIGAGLGGSLAAIFLGRAGVDVGLYEMRPDPRRGALVGGRSINLALSARGLHALQEAGLLDRVLRLAVPMRGRMIHDRRGHTAFQPYGTRPEHANHSVSRADLNVLLLEAAEKEAGVQCHFGRKCVDVDLEAPAATFETEDGGSVRVQGDVLLGTDGAFSLVRRRMQRLERFDYEQAFLTHGYKELTIAAGPDGTFRMEREALHIWPRGGFMMIALPNRDGSFTCTLFWPHEGPLSFASVATPDDVRRVFEREFPDALPLLPDVGGQYAKNPVGSMVTIRCRPWHHGGRAALLGDAAHAVVPFHGQGANCAFEDAVVLDACVRRHAPDWKAVFSAFEAARKEHSDALAQLSLDNFVEMRDATGSRLFRARKAVEKGLYRAFPGLFMPLYMMIAFSRIPYAETVRRARLQSRLVGSIATVLGAVLVCLLLAWWQGQSR
jgi:kynurenine 3-monooxygenase